MYKPDATKESKPSKIKGVLCARCSLPRLRCSEDHNLDTSTFRETAGLSTLCDGLRWDASKQADFQKMLSTPRLPAPLLGPHTGCERLDTLGITINLRKAH